MRANALWPVVLVVLFLGSGCQKPKPSPAFQEAETLHRSLYAMNLDDAYLDPQMNHVEELLGLVPADSRDFAAASELRKRIEEGRARALAAVSERDRQFMAGKSAVPFTGSSDWPENRPDAGSDDAGSSADAGALTPVAGMPEEELTQRFSRCFETTRNVEVPGIGLLKSYALKDLSICRELFPNEIDTVFPIQNEKILGRMPHPSAVTQYRYLDGGLADAG